MEEWREIQGILDKIRGTSKGGISADDPESVQKLKIKLEGLEQTQAVMKAVNAYYRKNKTLDGCPGLSVVEIEKLKAGMARNRRANPKPYESYVLTNNSAAIRQVKARIEELTRKAETEYEGRAFDGGIVAMDRQANRLQVCDFEKKRYIIAGVFLLEQPERVIGMAEIFGYDKTVNMVEIGYRINESCWHRA